MAISRRVPRGARLSWRISLLHGDSAASCKASAAVSSRRCTQSATARSVPAPSRGKAAWNWARNSVRASAGLASYKAKKAELQAAGEAS